MNCEVNEVFKKTFLQKNNASVLAVQIWPKAVFWGKLKMIKDDITEDKNQMFETTRYF